MIKRPTVTVYDLEADKLTRHVYKFTLLWGVPTTVDYFIETRRKLDGNWKIITALFGLRAQDVASKAILEKAQRQARNTP